MNESLSTVINDCIKQNQSNIQTALPARVVSFNGHTVTCELMITRIATNGKEIEIPPLVDVPVQFPHAGGFCFTVPIKAGDEGLAIFSSRCIDGWYESSNKSEPLDNRMHDLSDASFIVGVNSVPNKIPNFYHDGASMQTDDGSTFIRLTNGTIYIQGNINHKGNTQQLGNYDQIGNFSQTGGNSTSSGTITATDVKTSKGIDMNTHTHTGVKSGDETTGGPK